VVGLGLIGGSVALAARTAWPRAVVVGLDRAAEVTQSAHRAVVHEIVETASGLAACDLIVIATPLPSVADAVRDVAATGTHAVVTDVGSTKRDVMAAAREAGLGNFIGGHPMAGSERGGLGQARADLFEGRPWLLVNGSAADAACGRLAGFVAALGAIVEWIDADAHDRTVAYVSHLPQVLAVALVNAARDNVGEAGLRAGGRAFSEMTRVASSPSDMWEAIFRQNGDFVAEALSRFIEALPDRGSLGDAAWVREAFARAERARGRAIEAAGGKF
jgi:prephenate dehydrogenase